MSDEHFTSFDDVRRAGKIISLSDVQRILQQTEPVVEHLVNTDGTSDVKSHFPDGWNYGIKELDDNNITTAKLSFGGNTFSMTKRAALSLMSLIGVSDRYAMKVPGSLIEPHVDYWFQNLGVGVHDQIKILTKDNYVVGFMNPSADIISNLEVLDYIRKYYKGKTDGSDIFFTPDIKHNYTETDFRIVLPKIQFTVETERGGTKVVDKWHYGVHVTNSLVASASNPLTITGFMMEQRSLASILPEHSQLAGFSRQTHLDKDDLRGWIRSTLDQIDAVLPVEGEAVVDMVKHDLGDSIGDTISDIFRSMKIHRKVQEESINILTDGGDMTAYGVMYSLAKATVGQFDKMSNKTVNHVQKVAGALPNRTDDLCSSCGRLHMVH